MMSAEEFRELAKDIKENGLREPIWLYEKQIIDGRNRYRACIEVDVKPRFQEWDGNGSLAAFVISLNLHRRHLSESQRSMVAARIATLERGDNQHTAIAASSQSEVADMLNVSEDSIQRGKKVLKSGSEELVEAVTKGDIAVSTASEIATLPKEEQKQIVAKGESEILKAAKDIKRERAQKRQVEREEKKREAVMRNHPLQGKEYKLIHGDLEEMASEIAEGSIDAIITDPPYKAEFLDTYDKLSRLASRVLRPGGHCLVMVGQSHLPEILVRLCLNGGLSYQWTLAYFTPGQSTQVFGRKIKSNWKPVLWLVKGTNNWEHVQDTIQSGENDKRFHEWGQSVSGMASIVERFTVKKSLILDPFCGGGTTGVASLLLDRLFIGIDIEAACIQQTAERLSSIRYESHKTAVA